MLNFRQDAAYALVAPTSMGVRITPMGRQPVFVARDFRMQATSAESNVLSVSAALGLNTKLLTTFVQGSPVAQLIKADLGARGIGYEGPELDQDGPWGWRHQFNIADAGFGARGPRVHNDRAGEVGRTLNVKDFDLERIFVREGVQLLHLSGLIAAISDETAAFCLALARAAKAAGTMISFDLNYRASFWVNREVELHKVFTEIAGLTDILIGNEEDYQLALGLEGPAAGGVGIDAEIEAFKGMIETARVAYPNASAFATTLRQVVSANRHMWGALLWQDGAFHVAMPREIEVLDRIGGGDATVGGMLYGMLRGWDAEKSLQFGWACGAYVVTMETDYALPMDEAQIWSIWKGNARVQR